MSQTAPGDKRRRVCQPTRSRWSRDSCFVHFHTFPSPRPPPPTPQPHCPLEFPRTGSTGTSTRPQRGHRGQEAGVCQSLSPAPSRENRNPDLPPTARNPAPRSDADEPQGSARSGSFPGLTPRGAHRRPRPATRGRRRSGSEPTGRLQGLAPRRQAAWPQRLVLPSKAAAPSAMSRSRDKPFTAHFYLWVTSYFPSFLLQVTTMAASAEGPALSRAWAFSSQLRVIVSKRGNRQTVGSLRPTPAPVQTPTPCRQGSRPR